ncbi:MAG: OmpA family protein [Rhodobiaceae bacterium]|nr:OmpA family protein [Rhodobiaceae bacterium]MCC0048736.1 OmpA family protein [Rhodobiaceae bacterium]
MPLALITLLALYFKPAPIESDLSVRAASDLAAAGHEWAEISVDGRDLTLSGTAPSEEAQGAARSLAMRTWGVRTVNDTSSLLALADPFIWNARRDETGVRITGNVPSTAARATMFEAARAALPGVDVNVSGLVAARGVPDEAQWTAATRFGLTLLAQLDTGEVSLRNLAFSVIGAASSPQSYETIVTALRALPDGVTMAAESVSAPVVSPHKWDASYSDGRLVMSGYAPDFAARDALAAAIRDLLPGAEVTSDVVVAAGGIDSALWSRTTSFVLQQFSRLKGAKAALENDRLSISGEAASIEDYESVLAALDAVPAGIVLLRADITPAAADTFAWIASLSADGLALSGYVPSDAAQQRILDLASKTFPGMQVRNRMRVAQGPDEATDEAWTSGAGFSFEVLGYMSEGSALMIPGSLSFDGAVRSPEFFDAAMAALKAIPDDFSLARNGLQPAIVDPFVWSARLEANSVSIEGFAPGAEARNALVGTFTGARPGTEVQSTAMVARGPLSEETFNEVAGFVARMFASFSEGTASLDGKVLSVSGIARDVDAFRAAEVALQSLPDGVENGKLEIFPAAIGVLSWTATRDANRLVLDGFVPSEAVRKTVLAAAKQAVPGGEVTDRMEIASGGPEAAIWGPATSFALKQLGRMTQGQVRISGIEFSLEGITPDFPAYDGILADVPAAMPGGLKLVRSDILPPAISPYVWSAKRDAASITLSGHVPSNEVRKEIADFARERFAGLTVRDEMKLASGAPDGMVQAVGVAFAALGQLFEGSATLADRRVTVTGDAPDRESAETADELIAKRLPAGFSGTSSIRVAEAPPQPEPQAPGEAEACQDRLNTIMTGNTVLFEVNSADIRAESFALLDRIAEAAQGCQGFGIEVGGHTDSDGPEEYNLDLSQKRAQSVVRYLVGKGVSGQRLKAVGYGETKPIASNDNDAGKARNRRIEFTITQ